MKEFSRYQHYPGIFTFNSLGTSYYSKFQILILGNLDFQELNISSTISVLKRPIEFYKLSLSADYCSKDKNYQEYWCDFLASLQSCGMIKSNVFQLNYS